MADVSSLIENWSTTASSNSPSDATTIGAGLADNFQQIQATVRTALASKGADVASATTTDIGAVPGLFLDVTGTTTITGLGTIAAGIWKVLKFEGALTLTHNATSLILPGGGNITTADGDVAIMVSEGSGNWRCVCYAGKNSYATNGKFTGTLDVTGTTTAAAINASGNVAVTGTSSVTGATGTFQVNRRDTSATAWNFYSTAGELTIRNANSGNTVTAALATDLWAFPAAMTVGGTLGVTGAITGLNATAIPAGGTTGSGILVSSTANFGVFFGSGAPTLSAAKGSLYLRSDGSTTNDRMYVNTNGTTTWTAVTTAA